MTDEVWKTYRATRYQVSNLGNVRGPSGKILKPRPNGKQQYLRVNICEGGHMRDEYISRMVAETFIGPPPDADSHADHKNRNRANNREDNIQWLTPEANRASRIVAKGEKHYAAKVTEEIVRSMRMEPKRPRIAILMGQKFGISREQARDILAGKSWTHVQ